MKSSLAPSGTGWLLSAAIVVTVAGPAAAQTVPSQAAVQYAGSTRTVCGTVVAVRLSGGNQVLDFEGPTSQTPVSVVIRTADGGLDMDAKARAVGIEVCATGKIQAERDKTSILLNDLTGLRAARLTLPRPADFLIGDAVDLTKLAVNPAGGGTRGRGPAPTPASGHGVTSPRAVSQPEPRYSPLAKRLRIGGDVTLEGIVRADGTVGLVRVVESLDALYGLDAEAIRCVKTWKFKPGTRNGQPVDVVVTFVLSFRPH